MMESLHVKETTRQMMAIFPKQMEEMMQASLQKRMGTLKKEDVDRLHQEVTEFTDEVGKNLPIDGMIDDIVPVYQKYFSKEDIDAVVAFYSSTRGQKFLSKATALQAEAMEAMTPRLKEYMEAMMAKADERAKKMVDERAAEGAEKTK